MEISTISRHLAQWTLTISRVSISSLKSSTVSIAEISDHIQSFLKWSVVPIAALAAMASVSSTTPASAGEYCRRDVTSQVVSCSFDSLERCQWTSSGRGGDCFRGPWLPAADKLAYAPHALRARPKAHHAPTIMMSTLSAVLD
jgi:hypothetical protein